MTILLLILGLATSFYGKFYIARHKKKLSDDNIIEFEKAIKPKVIRPIYFSFLPMLALSVYLISGVDSFNIRLFIYTGLAVVALTVFGYFQAKKTIYQSVNSTHYKYVLNYFIFVCITQLFILAAVTNSLKDVFSA